MWTNPPKTSEKCTYSGLLTQALTWTNHQSGREGSLDWSNPTEELQNPLLTQIISSLKFRESRWLHACMHLSVPVHYSDCFDFKHILHKTGPLAICRIYSLELPNILKLQPLTTFLDPAATRSIPSPGHGLHPLQLAEAGGVVSVRWLYVGICYDAWAAEECFSSNTANRGTAWGCHGSDRSKTCWSWITCTHTLQ